jgi:hypothetical protein
MASAQDRDTGGEPQHPTGMDLLPDDLRAAFSLPPPRQLPPGTWGRSARAKVGIAFWIGVALLTTGVPYAALFWAMKAPWQIPTAAATVAGVGVLLLVAYLAAVARQQQLLRTGVVVEGRLEAIAKVKPGSPQPAFGTSVEVVCSCIGPSGVERRASSYILWRESFSTLEPGDPVPVCCDPQRPHRQVILLALVS